MYFTVNDGIQHSRLPTNRADRRNRYNTQMRPLRRDGRAESGLGQVPLLVVASN
jgi:hypothetical protein